MSHKQVWLKVNAMCDEGVAPLVAALNEIAGLVTLDSCQGDEGRAYVYFTYEDGEAASLTPLVREMADGLATQTNSLEYSLELLWLGTNDRPRALISVAPEHVAQFSSAIQLFAVMSGRKNRSSGGRSSTESGSWTRCQPLPRSVQ